MRSQIISIFIVDYYIDDEHDIDVNLVSLVPWRLYVDGLVCSNGQSVCIVYISPHGVVLKPHAT